MLVVGIGTMALIIVLSVFNGLEGLLRSIYGDFDPEIVITPSEGKSFTYTAELQDLLEGNPDIEIITRVVEDNVLIKYRNAQRVVRMKGVSDNFLDQGRLQKSIVLGSLKLREDGKNYAILGQGIQYDLSVNPNNNFYNIQVYYPRDLKPGQLNPDRLYTVQYIMPAGIFAIEKYYDENYIIVPVDFATKLLNYGNRITQVELTLKSRDRYRVKSELIASLGSEYQVLLGEELHEDIYKIFKYEKLMVFFIFTMIIAIASINIYFSLSMLAIDKKRDVAILTAQGASKKLISSIFLVEGCIIAFSGTLVGLALGLGICFAQMRFELIGMGIETAVMSAYPVKVEFWDIVLTCLTVIIITILASFQPSRLATKKIAIQDL